MLATITLTGACTASGGGGGGGTAFNWEGCYGATGATAPDIDLIHPLNQADNAFLFNSNNGSCTGLPTNTVTLISLVTPDQTLADTTCQVSYGKTGALPVGPPTDYVKSDGTQLTNTMYWCY
jgi:hypothetical protein